MRKNTLFTTVVFAILSVIDIIVYLALDLTKVIETDYISYLCWLGFFVLIWLPFLVEILFKMKINLSLTIAFDIFLLLSLVVGSQWEGYSVIPSLDKIVHFGSGILFALAGYVFFKHSKVNRANLFWLFFLTFSVAMMCGGVWEIYEFVSDGILNNNAQGAVDMIGRAAIMDTMWDLTADFFGAIVGGIAVVLMEKFGKKEVKEKTINA